MKPLPRWCAGSLAVLALASPGQAREPGILPFTQDDLARAQAGGGPVVIETYAYWCLACRVQAPILAQLRQGEPYRNLVILRIDETTPGRVWRQFHLRGYGTLVVFRGAREVGRGTPTTREAAAALIDKAL